MGAKLGILVATLAVIGSHYSMSSKLSIADTSSTISNSQYEVLARNAALTGFERAKQRLATSFSSTSLEGTSESISYSTEVSVSGDVAKITSTGIYHEANEEEKSYVIKAEFDRSGGGVLPGSTPTYMTYALLAEESLELSGNGGAAHIYVPGVGGATLNANFHTNGDLDVSGKGNARIKGFGTYSGSASGKHRNTKFQPNFNPAGLDHTLPASPIEIPSVDVADILTRVTPDVSLPLGILSGTQAFTGTQDNPTIVHVPGDLTIHGLISGYVVFLVEGNITVVGNTLAGYTGNLGKDESSMAFYGMGDFTMQGNTEAWGQILVNGDFTMGGNSLVYGSVTVGGKAWMHGTPDIYYREASETLTEVLEPTPLATDIRMVAYGEF